MEPSNISPFVIDRDEVVDSHLGQKSRSAQEVNQDETSRNVIPGRDRNGIFRGGAGPGFANRNQENQLSLMEKVIDAVSKRLADSDLKQVINDRIIDPAFNLLLQRSIPYLVVAGIAYFVLILLLIGLFFILIKQSAALKKISESLPALNDSNA
jgi:hypothetical protein